MKVEYKIKIDMPDGFDPTGVLKKLPSPISPEMTEIYNYPVEKYGFYFIDNHVDQKTSGHAISCLLMNA